MEPSQEEVKSLAAVTNRWAQGLQEPVGCVPCCPEQGLTPSLDGS